MQAGATFADMLDATLGAPTARPRPAGYSNRPITPPLFAFEFPLRTATAGAPVRNTTSSQVLPFQNRAVRVADQSPIRDQRRAGSDTAPPFRPAAAATTRLTALEARAMAALNALGAGLDETVSPETLRRAFRRLAHRYHPDRHPGIGAAETARLARQFAGATEHYRLLAAGLDRRFTSR